MYPIDQIKDPLMKLQLIALQDKGSGALSQDKLDHVSHVPIKVHVHIMD